MPTTERGAPTTEPFLLDLDPEHEEDRYSSFESFVRNPPRGLKFDPYSATTTKVPYVLEWATRALAGRHRNIPSMSRATAYLMHYGAVKVLKDPDFKGLKHIENTLYLLVQAISPGFPTIADTVKHSMTMRANELQGYETKKVTIKHVRLMKNDDPMPTATEILLSYFANTANKPFVITLALSRAISECEEWLQPTIAEEARKIHEDLKRQLMDRVNRMKQLVLDLLVLSLYSLDSNPTLVDVKVLSQALNKIHKHLPEVEMRARERVKDYDAIVAKLL